MRFLPGAGLVLLGLAAGLLRAHVRALRFFDRPAVARNRLFDPALAALKWAALAAGVVRLHAASPAVGLGAAAALLMMWSWLVFVRSVRFQGWLLRRQFEALRRGRPGVPEADLLFELLMRRHPAWGEELIAQMVGDDPTIEGLARTMARMERGFRGFRP